MTANEVAERAVSRFLGGFHCAESVLLTLAEHYGVSDPLIPKIATPFGGGIARSASVCGCVTGALMGIGAKYGRTQPTDDRRKAYSLATDFMAAFEKRYGSLVCHDLIGCDFGTPEGRKRFEELKESRCADFVRSAIMIMLELDKRTV